MRRYISVITILFILSIILCACGNNEASISTEGSLDSAPLVEEMPDNEKIIGKWEYVDGEYSFGIEFYSDGTCVAFMNGEEFTERVSWQLVDGFLMVDSNVIDYEFKGNTLFLHIDELEVPFERVPNEEIQIGSSQDINTITPEPVTVTKGKYSLNECGSGIYISYDDGSFDKYPTGGYCEDLTLTSSSFYGMFISNETVKEIPQISKKEKLVVFSSEKFTLNLLPVNSSVGAIQVEAKDGTTGYGRIYQQNENGVWVHIQLENHEDTNLKVMYINGVPASEYEAQIVEYVVKPSAGVNKTYTVTSYGFLPDSTVTFGVASGSTLVESTYNVSATFYDCTPDHNNYDVEDVYHVVCSPTAEGYATVDMIEVYENAEIPSGQYIMVYRSNGKYQATLLNWNNG